MPNKSPIYVWAFLAFATLASWGIGARDPLHALPLLVVMIAVIKCRLVIRYFMDVRHAPAWLRYSCDAWLLLNLAMATSAYWA